MGEHNIIVILTGSGFCFYNVIVVRRDSHDSVEHLNDKQCHEEKDVLLEIEKDALVGYLKASFEILE